MRKYHVNRDGVHVTAGPTNEFRYSDGAQFERDLLAFLNDSKDVSEGSIELAKAINRGWGWKYHLSSKRGNLLRDIALRTDADFLELGAGCGALTRHLGERGCRVDAVEGSYTRAKIARERTRDLLNVGVYHEQIENFVPEKKYDYVSLVGVLEYAAVYGKAKDAHGFLLTKASEFLKNDGVLIVAIENRLGAKYLAGAVEDHVQKSFYGVGNRYGPSEVQTFTVDRLRSMLSSAGFSHRVELMPLPDYKIVEAVVNPTLAQEKGLDFSGLVDWAAMFDWQMPSQPLFELGSFFSALSGPGEAIRFANSFLILASASPKSVEALEPDWSASRASLMPEFQLRQTVRFRKLAGSLVVDRNLIDTAPSRPHAPSEFAIIQDSVEPFYPGRTLGSEMRAVFSDGEWGYSDIGEFLADLVKVVSSTGLGRVSNRDEVNSAYLDCHFDNVIRTDNGSLTAIDQTWRYSGRLEMGAVLTRALVNFFFGEHPPNFPKELLGEYREEFLLRSLRTVDPTTSSRDLEAWLSVYRDFHRFLTGEEWTFRLAKPNPTGARQLDKSFGGRLKHVVLKIQRNLRAM